MTLLHGTTVPLDSQRPFKAKDPSYRYRLTPTEREVASLLIAGLATREIAAVRGVTPKRVECVISNIIGKLGVQNRREALPLLSEVQAQVLTPHGRQASCSPC